MFHLLKYKVTAGINDANVDMTAVQDPEFSQRSNHYIFSEPYNLLAWKHLGVSVTRCRFNVPTINAIARHQVWPVSRSAVPQSYHRMADYRRYPIPLPINEEIALEESGNLGAATELETSFLWIAPPEWNMGLARGIQRLTVRFTASPATVVGGWSGGANVTFAENLRGGWYAVNSCWYRDATSRAFRLIFPRMPLIRGRKYRPGSATTAADGNIEDPILGGYFGHWGYFHTFEPFQIEIYADAAPTNPGEGRLDITYMGTTAPQDMLMASSPNMNPVSYPVAPTGVLLT